MVRLNRSAAEQQEVEPVIHPKDYIYRFCLSTRGSEWASGINYYFEDGGRSTSKLREIVTTLGYEKDDKIKLLEFASGYGCVSRHLKKEPRFDLVSCDIHTEAVDFLASQFGINAIPSVHLPEEFSPPEKYDLIFALSFFSHMPRATWGRWLRALFAALKAPGYLVFTTHGEWSRKATGLSLDDFQDGFWFSPQTEQHDLDTSEYGFTISMPEFVVGEIYRELRCPIVLYKYAEWWKVQDLWVVKREKDCLATS
jgi:SAM-dependent methyltransferase